MYVQLAENKSVPFVISLEYEIILRKECITFYVISDTVLVDSCTLLRKLKEMREGKKLLAVRSTSMMYTDY